MDIVKCKMQQVKSEGKRILDLKKINVNRAYLQ